MPRIANALGAWMHKALGRRSTLVAHSATPHARAADFPIGCDAAGVSYVLNYETGAIGSALSRPR